MVERLTEETHRVLVFAEEEARRLGHPCILPGHLLLGLVRADTSGVAQILAPFGVSLDTARQSLVRAIGRREQPSIGAIPVGKEAMQLFRLARHTARRFGDGHIGPEHLLLLLVQEDKKSRLESVVTEMLSRFDVASADVHRRVAQRLSGAS